MWTIWRVRDKSPKAPAVQAEAGFQFERKRPRGQRSQKMPGRCNALRDVKLVREQRLKARTERHQIGVERVQNRCGREAGLAHRKGQ